MIRRRLQDELIASIDQYPAVVLVGPRQAGKTTLALEVARGRPALYLDRPPETVGRDARGRISHLELGPFDALEVPSEQLDALWTRGGFPDSFLAADDPRSFRWRQDFIRTYLQREIPQFGPRIPAET